MDTTTTEPVEVLDSSSIVKAKAEELIDMLKAGGWARRAPELDGPKSVLVDPSQLLDAAGLGFRHHPSALTYDTLEAMTQRDPVIAAIIQTRIQQVSSFARPQANKYSIGFKINHRDKRQKMDDSIRKRIAKIEKFVLNLGAEYERDRDSFETWIKKFLRDRLTWDQATFEKVWSLPSDMNRHGKLLYFLATPSETMRIAQPKNKKGYVVEDKIRYVQLIDGKIRNEYTADEMAFCVANPRSQMTIFGYGYSELEMLLQTITAHLWAEEWNRKMFSNGATIKGILNMKGNIPPAQLDAFRRQWATQVSGVNNAWKTPVLNAEGVEWFPLQLSNTEMGYQMWLEYLIKVACACFQMDPSEINFDIRGGGNSSPPMFMTTNEAQQKYSRDRGLRPLLRFVADSLNRHVIWELDDNYEIDFVGLDAKTEEQAIELRLKEVQNYKTLNEVRAEEDLPPVKNGDIILNPTYTGWLGQQQMQQQQGAGGMPGMGGPGGPGGEEEEPPPEGMVEHMPRAFSDAQGQPKKYGQPEKEATQALQNFANGGKKKEEHEESSPLQVGEEDWESTIHAALKNKPLEPKDYFVIDTSSGWD